MPTLTSSAFNDLQEITAYYAEQGVPHVGQRLLSEIISHIETLPANPKIGRIVPEFADPNLRELIHPPFRIVNWLENQSINVIRIWRSERLLILPDAN